MWTFGLLGTQSNYITVIIYISNGALYYFVNDGSSAQTRITASGAITPGVWYHIAL